MVKAAIGILLSMTQTTSHIIMIEPRGFCSNPETAVTNPHQASNPENTSPLQEKALAEHRAFQKLLTDRGIKVTLFEGRKDSPDDLFCNNWIMTREGKYALFPMLAPNRRIERRKDITDTLPHTLFKDYSPYETQHKFLESTGSLVLDHKSKIAYAALSPRTDESLVKEWATDFNYTPVTFTSFDKAGKQEYHTNVMMFIGTKLAGVCLQNIDEKERAHVKASLSKTHTILELTPEQITKFAGNAIELHNDKGQRFLVMSKTGYDALKDAQKKLISEHVDDVITPDISTIETYGGGSARCLILEVF